jgi:CHASE2 domain-containing sensor protein
VIDRLHADGASTIVYDVQFTEPSRLGPRDDLALYEAIGRAGKVVLATTEVDARDQTNVLGVALAPLWRQYMQRALDAAARVAEQETKRQEPSP